MIAGLSFLIASSALAQDQLDGTYPYDADVSITAGYHRDWNNASIDPTAVADHGFGPSDSCGMFEDGTASGFWGSIGGTWRTLPKLFVHADIGVSFASHALTFTCVDPAQIRMPAGGLGAAITEHRLTFNTVIGHLAVGPIVTPGRDLPVRIGLHGSLFAYIANPNYEVSEEIREPAAAEFLSGGQQRAYGSGSFMDHGFTLVPGATFTLSYDLPAGGLWYLRPVVAADYLGSTDVAGGTFGAWRIRLGLGLATELELNPGTSTPLRPSGS
jgi:hypothetical protein